MHSISLSFLLPHPNALCVGLRYLEAFFGMLITVMCGMFGWMVRILCNESYLINCFPSSLSLPLSPLSPSLSLSLSPSFAQYIYARPNQLEVFKGAVIPWCHNCTNQAVQQGLGVVGAVIMPHNLYLHSGLVLVSVESIIILLCTISHIHILKELCDKRKKFDAGGP